MRRQHLTKIVATLGPASAAPETIRALFDTGVDVFRLNFSHGDHSDKKASIDAIREIEKETGRPIAIMMDLQGPKLRVGTFPDGPIELNAGDTFRLELEDKPGSQTRVTLPHREIFAALEPSTDLLLDDGKIRLRVVECGGDFADTEVVTGGTLSDRKGVNVPGVVLPLSALTEKDLKDMNFGLDNGVDICALSFVQRPQDLADARKLIQNRAALLTKLEKPTAIQHLDELVEMSDMVMVARGDLGVEMPPEEVPVLQKRIVALSRQMGKPVIVATQMLESMITAPTPTRAEASDVATAVYDGADGVMLSAETAAGDYPIEAAAIMNRIVEHTESDSQYRRFLEAERVLPEATAADAISAAASQVAETLSAKAIVTYTTSGSTTRRAARERPEVPVIGLTPSIATARRLAAVWGVHSVHTLDARDFAQMVEFASDRVLQDGFAEVGDRIVITAGVPFGTPGATNILRIARVGQSAGQRR
ncbi:MAG TPA: pyruvate kinase [Rhodospirillaceae bacterium]|nr:pyruvate kinase [Rhodospirillaceae bacterium]HAT36515.1 pyruvate kinase [Rhodospirillaceae bacterium]